MLSWLNFSSAATYCASKAAAWSLSNGLRGELKEQKTQVLSVHVGYMDTDMTKGLDAAKLHPDEAAKRVLAALEAGSSEVLVDELSQNVKSGLSHGKYLEV